MVTCQCLSSRCIFIESEFLVLEQNKIRPNYTDFTHLTHNWYDQPRDIKVAQYTWAIPEINRTTPIEGMGIPKMKFSHAFYRGCTFYFWDSPWYDHTRDIKVGTEVKGGWLINLISKKKKNNLSGIRSSPLVAQYTWY